MRSRKKSGLESAATISYRRVANPSGVITHNQKIEAVTLDRQCYRFDNSLHHLCKPGWQKLRSNARETSAYIKSSKCINYAVVNMHGSTVDSNRTYSSKVAQPTPDPCICKSPYHSAKKWPNYPCMIVVILFGRPQQKSTGGSWFPTCSHRRGVGKPRWEFDTYHGPGKV